MAVLLRAGLLPQDASRPGVGVGVVAHDFHAAFVQNARTAAGNALVQAVLPPSFDRVKLGANAGLSATLIEIRTAIKQLASDVDDTIMAVGSDTVNAAAKLYGDVASGACGEGVGGSGGWQGESFPAGGGEWSGCCRVGAGRLGGL